ncbi:MAG TPA: TPM domain-containing protein [Thermodesulfobacteriota bacterium]|nr:TPM domain-containing protein [Thermodesulfobacteriota bacterium]
MRAHPKSERFFTKEEKERLKAATYEVESRTIGEIVVMVVDYSDHYIEAEVLGSVLLGSLLSLILSVLFFDSSLWFYIPLSFLFFFPCWFLFIKVDILKKPFIGIRRTEEAVRLRAERAFFERGLYRTKQNTGILFFLSLLERKVWVLADKGIYQKMNQETLNRFANEVSRGIREGRACHALCQAIQEIGTHLATYFPITPNDINELPDGVITEE